MVSFGVLMFEAHQRGCQMFFFGAGSTSGVHSDARQKTPRYNKNSGNFMIGHLGSCQKNVAMADEG